MPTPSFKKTCLCTILPPPVINFSDLPPEGGLNHEILAVLSSFKLKGRVEWTGRLANFSQNNKWGGCNKRGGWQKSPKLINGEVGINGETGKNTAIRNFIEIKSSNKLVKISTKKHKKYKASLSAWRITCSFAWFSSSRYVLLQCNQKTILSDVEEILCDFVQCLT